VAQLYKGAAPQPSSGAANIHGTGQAVPGAALLKRPYPDKKWTSMHRQAGNVSEAKGIH